jgi:hypothetical protein
MAITKDKVFIVSGRAYGNDSSPRGSVHNSVVCSLNEESVRALLSKQAPDFSILSITSLDVLEMHVKKVKAALAGHDQDLKVLIDPALGIN